jgi:hypothetical protein
MFFATSFAFLLPAGSVIPVKVVDLACAVAVPDVADTFGYALPTPCALPLLTTGHVADPGSSW